MEPVVEDEAGTRRQRRQQPDHLGVDVEQGKRVEAAIPLTEPMVRNDAVRGVEELLLAQPDHLGRTRRARGGQHHSSRPDAPGRCMVSGHHRRVDPLDAVEIHPGHSRPGGCGLIGHHHVGTDALEGRGEPRRGKRRVERSDPEPGGERPEERGREP
jgi:hypothetical protein